MTRALLVFFCLIGLAACGEPGLEEASRSYRETQDFASLEILHAHLTKGMPRPEVERLLGEPDYSPTDGQYYYGSDRTAPQGEDGTPGSTIGLVVDYRDGSGAVTNELQSFDLRPIGE